MTKTRVAIPRGVAADVMFASNSTCCKCDERGKSVQIHHLDEDPSNNDSANLAGALLQCAVYAARRQKRYRATTGLCRLRSAPSRAAEIEPFPIVSSA
jgi:hypothetical protein